MLQPTRHQPTRHLVEFVRQVEGPPAPTAALVLDSLGRMHPATAITLVLTVAGMTAGAVVAVVALVGMVVAAVAAIAGMVAVASIGALAIAVLLAGTKAKT